MIARDKGVLVAAVDIQSGTWKMAREIFQVLQKETTSKRTTVNEINIKAIQEVATDIGVLLKYTSDIRGRNAKIQRETEKIDEGLDEIKDAVGNFQKELKTAVAEIEPESMETMHMTKLSESDIASIG
jgi:succinate dehydrogenase/fumarate reductase flavoprotein subunit